MQLQSNPSLFHFSRSRASVLTWQSGLLKRTALLPILPVIEHDHMQGVIDRSLSAVQVVATSVRQSDSDVARRARTSSEQEHVVRRVL